MVKGGEGGEMGWGGVHLSRAQGHRRAESLNE